MTIKVNELGAPLSSHSPRIGYWITVEGSNETVRINSVNYSDASVEVEHMNGIKSHHFFKDILYISEEYYDPKDS